MEDDTGHRVRNLLENFDVISTYTHMAIVPAGELYQELIQNVKTAVAATSLGLTSLDYTRKAYVENIEPSEEIETSLDKEYTKAYFLAKNYVHEARKRLITSERDLPSMGVFGSSVVLERLESTLFSAHLLYSLGNVYEGHAVSRVMLEQIAWAYQASGLNDREAISKIKPNQAISQLKKFLPKVGKLYGYLSKHTHIDYHRHHEFIKAENNQNVVLLGQDRLDECAMVLLHLADIFVVVWEFSQHDYLNEFTAIDVKDNVVNLLDNRLFSVQMEAIIDNMETIRNKMDSET
ncbi:hypothetical protein [Crocosphaera sp.]|uniref:hypothetical protein n=1 Tax=Crocosphaera sp. TaxID=2729996 RepID=UPI003F29C3D5|nr:hypothetical protein [Crocosphaera sp.]